MEDEDDRNENADTEDASFVALLKRAAHISGPTLPAGLENRLHPQATLLDGRLRIKRRIGEGGMGVVYEAHDERRGGSVALKTLSRLYPDDVYRLKNEFRSLADLNHTNLCRLHELFSEGGEWFFTMELVDGEPFDRWVRPDGELDDERVRAALAQLCAGIAAVHAAGKLHRDLKPSNVLVAQSGRLVVLDFGLAVDSDGGGVGQTLLDQSVSGTPAYMAPEQAAGNVATTASDFYALGVMLFEALTGQLPFGGRVAQMLAAKQRDEAPCVHDLQPSAPVDLAQLCDELLRRDPRERPTADVLAARLGHAGADLLDSVFPRRSLIAVSRHSEPAAADDAAVLLGRDTELQALRDAYATMLAGKPVVMFVSGESGMGKSALVSTFLDELRASGEATVLAGRCHERENVPFKGFDALVDDLSRHLRKLSREQASVVLPREVFALARVFPVLRRVPVVAEAPERAIHDPQDLRRRAFAAFGELLARMRDRRPLCIHIDDLQWVDQDSVLFMRALLVDRDPAPVMLLLSHRSEGAQQNRRLCSVAEVAEANSMLLVERLSVTRLDEASAGTLALQSLPIEVTARDVLAGTIARESGGSPFFIAELARYSVRTGGSLSGLSLSAVLNAHVAALDARARSLLEVTALAGQPLSLAVLLRAASSTHDALDELRARHLVRRSTAEGDETVECYHDRIRESVVNALSNEARSHAYGALGNALLAVEGADPELLATCFEGSGQGPLAAGFAAIAAARAEQGMAFDRAAELYRKALALSPSDDPERQARRVARAEALANAGRGKEAADAYLEAASSAQGVATIDLRRKAADELLTCGHVAEGKRLLEEVCAAVGVRLPRSMREAMLSLGFSQARLRLRKLDVDCRKPRPLTATQRLRLEVAVSATTALTAHDPITAAVMADQTLLLALDGRDPYSLAHAVCFQAFFTTAFTPRAEARIAKLYALAERYAATVGERATDGMIAMRQGTGRAYGRSMTEQTARALLLQSLELLRGCRGVRYHVDAANIFLVLVPTSNVHDETRIAAQLVEESLSLGRIWCAGMVAGSSSVARLAAGDEAGLARHLHQVQAEWKAQNEMAWVDSSLLRGAADIAFYRGEPESSFAAFERAWPKYERSMISRAAASRRDMHAYRGLLALSLLRRETGGQRKTALRALATADAQTVKDTARWHAVALNVGLALEQSDRDRASHLLRTFVSDFSRSPSHNDLPLLCARRRLGQLLGADQGATLVSAADAELRSRGVAEVERTTELILPGCWID